MRPFLLVLWLAGWDDDLDCLLTGLNPCARLQSTTATSA